MSEEGKSAVLQGSALDHLPEKWVSIIGPARGGKSFLLDLLHGKEGTFESSNASRGFTKGVQTAPAPVRFEEFASRQAHPTGRWL